MRRATADDLGVLDAISYRAGMPPLPPTLLDTCIVLIGEHGLVAVDPLDGTKTAIHVTVDPEGRGKWAQDFFRSSLRWLFTNTRVESVWSQIAIADKHVVRFATDSWFIVFAKTERFTYVGLDIAYWIANDPELAGEFDESDFPFFDRAMVARVACACAKMKEAGMPAKAWYIHNLCAKLFGYRAEV